jgi:hypothetical protein
MNAVVVERQQTLPGVAEPAAVTPMQLLQVAMSQGADLQKLEKLMELQERWEANQARKAFDAAISSAKAEIKPIVKNREVDFTSQKGRTNYEYEDFAAVSGAVDPILSKYGLSYRHRSKQDGKSLTITCRISHRDGHFEDTELSALNDESGNKNGIQGIGSTATYLQRYTLKIALGLAATKDDDGRASAGDEPLITNNQLADLTALLTEVNANIPAFLKVCKIDRLEDLPARKFKDAIARLEEKRRQS